MTLGWHCCVIGLSSWLCSYYALVRNLLETGYICLQDWWDCEVPWSMEWHLSKCRETDSALWVLRFLVSMFTCISPPITYISTLPHVSPSLSLSHFIIYIFFFFFGGGQCFSWLGHHSNWFYGFVAIASLLVFHCGVTELLKMKSYSDPASNKLRLALSCPCDLSEAVSSFAKW